MKYYKIQFGFNESEYLPITANELPKALALFMEKTGRGIFESGAIRGQDIMRIVEDWHRAKSWHQGYKMLPEDFEDIKPLQEKYRETYNKAKLIAEFALKENRRDLLSKPPLEAFKELPQREMPKQISEGVKKLADKFKYNDP